jgi:hypothetical protein
MLFKIHKNQRFTCRQKSKKVRSENSEKYVLKNSKNSVGETM